jgi:hypothetical protein
MRKLLDVLKALALITLIAVGASLLVLLLQVSSAVKRSDVAFNGVLAEMSGAIEGLNGVTAKADRTLDEVNRPCGVRTGGSLMPCGTLATVNKAVVDLGDITIATQLQVSQTGKLIAHSSELLDGIAVDVHGEMTEAQSATRAITESVTAAQPLLVNAAKTTQDVDALVLNPAIPKTLVNVQAMTASGAGILDDARIEADRLAKPNKKKLGFWTGVDATMLWIHSRVLPPIF